MILDTKFGAARFSATGLPVPERSSALTAYRPKAGKTVDGYLVKLRPTPLTTRFSRSNRCEYCPNPDSYTL